MKLSRALGTLGFASLFLASCSVGPQYQRPGALGTDALPGAFTQVATSNAVEWKAAEPAAHWDRGAWWVVFQDAELNRLESLATTKNQRLAAAIANFQQARVTLNIARSDHYPQISGAPAVSRQRLSENATRRGTVAVGSSMFTSFNIPFDASWELDLWGRVRRQVEGAKDRLQASQDDLAAVRLSIQAEVATDYFMLGSLDAQDALLRQTIETYRRSLDLTQTRHNGGIATELDVSQAETQLKTTEVQLPAVELQRANLRHALATLCGEAATVFQIQASTHFVPPSIPVSLPSELLERRPDVAAAERRMAAANADIGVAQTAFFPRILLNASGGFQSLDVGTVFDWPSRVWAIGPSVQFPIFTGGRNRAQLASARATYDAIVATYRQTVLEAFQDVEDQLAAQRLLADQLAAQDAALASTQRTLEIANVRYKGGVSTYLDVAISQNAALTTELATVKVRAERLSAAVSLIKALGAGWSSTHRIESALR